MPRPGSTQVERSSRARDGRRAVSMLRPPCSRTMPPSSEQKRQRGAGTRARAATASAVARMSRVSATLLA